MASRKEQKEQARQARIAAEQAAAAKAAQSRRLGIIAGVALVAVIIAAVVTAIAVSGTKTGGIPKTTKGKQQQYAAVASELAGIPQSGTTLGNPNAKVTMTYFGDLECPICKAFTLGDDGGGLPQFIAGPVKAGTVKIVYRSLCTATCNDYSNGQQIFDSQQVAAYAAGKQNLFWDYAELFYREQETEGSGYVNSAYLNGIADQIPDLKLATWSADLKDPDLLSQVQSDANTAKGDQLSSTPSVVMQGPKNEEVVSPGTIPTYSALTQAVSAVS